MADATAAATHMSPWIPLIVTIIIAIVGLAGQGVLVAFFLGKMRERQVGQELLVDSFQKFTEQTVAALMTRLGQFDSMQTESVKDRAALNARLTNLETNTAGLGHLREEFITYRATQTEHGKRLESDLARVGQGVESLQRQMANLVSGRAGQVTTITAADKPQQ